MRLLQFAYYEDVENILIDKVIEEQISDIKLFYSIKDYLKLRFEVEISKVINIGNIKTFEQWVEEEMLQWYLDMGEYEGELLDVVKRLLSY